MGVAKDETTVVVPRKLKAELDKLKYYEKTLYMDRLKGKISEELYTELWRDFKDQHDRVKAALDSIGQEKSYFIKGLDDAVRLIAKLGILYEKLGYHDQSILHLQNLLEDADIDLEAEIRYYIGEAYFGKGDYEHAILEFLKVPYLVTKKGRVDWTPNAFYMSAQAYEKMGKYDQAIGMYRQIVDRPGIDQTFKAAALKEIDRVNTVLKKPGKKPGE